MKIDPYGQYPCSCPPGSCRSLDSYGCRFTNRSHPRTDPYAHRDGSRECRPVSEVHEVDDDVPMVPEAFSRRVTSLAIEQAGPDFDRRAPPSSNEPFAGPYYDDDGYDPAPPSSCLCPPKCCLAANDEDDPLPGNCRWPAPPAGIELNEGPPISEWDQEYAAKASACQPPLECCNRCAPSMTDMMLPPEAIDAYLEEFPPPAQGSLPTDDELRNAYPMADCLLDYFPNALAEVSRLSLAATAQHHPGEKPHWDRSKSLDHRNKILRHLADTHTVDARGHDHWAMVCWRALAGYQEYLEAKHGYPPSRASRNLPGPLN